MAFLSNIIKQGKIHKVDSNKERIVNYIVLLGFILIPVWILFLFPRVFIDIKVVLLILFAPGLILTPLLYRRILTISGYELFIRNNIKYNSSIILLTYLLITVPVGNAAVTTFLLTNSLFADQETITIALQPNNISESHSRKTSGSYSHLDVEYDGVVKQINFGETPIDSMINKSLTTTLSKGLYGYYIIRKYTLKNSL